MPDTLDMFNLDHVVASFQRDVIDRFQIPSGGTVCDYPTYLSTSHTGDEAHAVDMHFTPLVIRWLGFTESDWTYNQTQTGVPANRPDFVIHAHVGCAFIWENKNSSETFQATHLAQMSRYSAGTAGYAVWCNLRRVVAGRFHSHDTLHFETLADIDVALLFSKTTSPIDKDTVEVQKTQLALLKLLFSKTRFTNFAALLERIAVDETTFLEQAINLTHTDVLHTFIAGSRQTLHHLRLAALARIQEMLGARQQLHQEEEVLQQEWNTAAETLIEQLGFNGADTQDPFRLRIQPVIDQLTARLGNLTTSDVHRVEQTIIQVAGKVSPTRRANLNTWRERATRINSAMALLRFQTKNLAIAEAYHVWSERQSDPEDVQPAIYAEQVAYVFFIRLLLVRILEDKRIIHPRLASDGGFLDWISYVKRNFAELRDIGVLNENFYDLLSRKAGRYYLHFFQQAVFDWFIPDDFLLVETLDFLCQYNFSDVTSDIIGFTYEQYIELRARKRKGHFLTPSNVVDTMLDILEYRGTTILGRTILDPACGSGSFLVRAARRYREALMESLCRQHQVEPDIAFVEAEPERRLTLARQFIEALTTCFFGMELNPFACYLAEMNLLIQALDDLMVLQSANEDRPIERFEIYNTDSLALPQEVTDFDQLSGMPTIPQRLSDRLLDDAYAIKTKEGAYAQGFFYIIANPPYITRKRESFATERLRLSPFFRSVLSGDTNTYLLFLRLGLYYLAKYGQMAYIVPLTLLGDSSARSARETLVQQPFAPQTIVRFYRGNVLFPGVDQAVTILRIDQNKPSGSVSVGGGHTLAEAFHSYVAVADSDVLKTVPSSPSWNGSWLVAPDTRVYKVWHHASNVSNNMTHHLGKLLDSTVTWKQGDVNATHLNPFRVGTAAPTPSGDDRLVAIYKGENVQIAAPLPSEPSDWALLTAKKKDSRSSGVYGVLQNLATLAEPEHGLVLRQVARLNTRERMIATWFVRDAVSPIVFTNELWRMIVHPHVSEDMGKGVLGLLISKPIAYLLNLFSSNNHVNKEEVHRIPIPAPSTFPSADLAALTRDLLAERALLEQQFVLRFNMFLPPSDDDYVILSPDELVAVTSLPTVPLSILVQRGILHNSGDKTAKIKTLRRRDAIQCTDDSFFPILTLFLDDTTLQETTWADAQQWLVPEPIAAEDWLQEYAAESRKAQASWQRYTTLLHQIDDAVLDWYGYDLSLRAAILEGIPWARAQR